MANRGLTQEQKDYIKTHLDEFPRNKMAEKLGIKLPCLYKYIRMYGGKINDTSKFDRLREKIKVMYETMTAKEIAEILDISATTIQFQATKHGYQHNQETIKRLNEERVSQLRKYWTKERYIEQGRKRHLLHKREELLVLSGLRQHTKLRIRRMQRKALTAKMYLRTKYNYFYSDGEPFVLCYNNETRRHPNEQYYTDKFGFEFVEASD
jgi:predicted transcriptional regulator